MGEFMSYDPWAQVVTRNGLAGDEMISMLQKSIRRGLEHFLKEGSVVSPKYEDEEFKKIKERQS